MLADIESLRRLPVAEKLQVIEMLWYDIETSGEELPLPEEEAKEIERRVREYQTNPSETFTREELWQRVDAKRG
jgi:putative addiction module component (TIGR02574 family)